MKNILYLFLLLSLTASSQRAKQMQYGKDNKVVSMEGSVWQYKVHPAYGLQDSLAAADKKYVDVLFSTAGGAVNQLQYSIVTDGDSTFTDAALIGQSGVVVIRDGREQSLTSQYIFDNILGKVTFRPFPYAGERIIIKYGNYTTTVVGGGSGGGYTPPAVLRDIDFQTVSSGLAKSGTSPIQWQGPDFSITYNNYGLADSSGTAATDFYIQWQVISGSSNNCIVGLDATHTNQRYKTGSTVNYEIGAMILSNTLYRLDGNTDLVSTGVTISGDLYIAIFKTNSSTTPVWKLRTSTDGTTWTDCYTYTYTGNVRLYPVISLPSYTNLSNPKCYNCHYYDESFFSVDKYGRLINNELPYEIELPGLVN